MGRRQSDLGDLLRVVRGLAACALLGLLTAFLPRARGQSAVPAAPDDAPLVYVCSPSPSDAELQLQLDDIALAIRLEARKRGISIRTERGRCGAEPPDSIELIAVPDGVYYWLDLALGDRESFDLTHLEGGERLDELARTVVERLQPAVRAQKLVRQGDRLRPPPPAVPRGPWQTGMRLGGGWMGDLELDKHSAAVEAEWWLRGLDDLLEVSIAATWLPSTEVAAPPARLDQQAVEVAARIRAGLRWGASLWQVGLGGGWMGRWYSYDNELRFGVESRTDQSGALWMEPAATWLVSESMHMAIAVPARVYFGGTTWTWLDETVRQAPNWSIGVSIRVGVTFATW